MLCGTTCLEKVVNKVGVLGFPSIPGERGEGREYSQKHWVVMCGQLPKTLTLFQTKICDFPCRISDWAKNSIPYFRPAL